MKLLAFSLIFFFPGAVFASEIIEPLTPMSEIEKVRKRLYPGGRDEEDLKVLAALPEATRKTDERAIQKEVYKGLFNQELSDSPDEGAEPETER
jgi:hypothetical protein